MEDSDYDQVDYEEAGGLGLTEIHTKIIPIRSYSQPNKPNRTIYKDSFPEEDFNKLKRMFARSEINAVPDPPKSNQLNDFKSRTLKDTTQGRITRTYLRTSPTMPRPRGISISKAKLKANNQDSLSRRNTDNPIKLLSIKTDQYQHGGSFVQTSSTTSLRADKLNFSLSREALIERKLELDRLSFKVERGPDTFRPIKDKRDPKSTGFLSWLGGLIGCGERN